MPGSMASTEIATQPTRLCLNGCITPCNNMGADADGCLLSATCALVCANVLAADVFDGLAAPSVRSIKKPPGRDKRLKMRRNQS
jgi:hypothetical protein